MLMLRSTLVVLLCSLLATATAAVADDAASSLIETKSGTLPIIITAPHGGMTDVPGVPVRVDDTAKRFVTGTDMRTAELARRIVQQLSQRLDGKPYLIAAGFRRRYIDANRAPEDAYESPDAKPIYDAYHRSIEEACRAVKNKFGGGLLVDVHGQAKHVDRLLVGTIGGKTIAGLRERHGTAAFSGRDGMLGFLNSAGLKISPEVDAVKLSLPEYDGGYTVLTYGSQNAAGLDAVQFEFGSELREPKRLDDSAERAAAAIAQFYAAYLPKKPLTATSR